MLPGGGRRSGGGGELNRCLPQAPGNGLLESNVQSGVTASNVNLGTR